MTLRIDAVNTVIGSVGDVVVVTLCIADSTNRRSCTGLLVELAREPAPP